MIGISMTVPDSRIAYLSFVLVDLEEIYVWTTRDNGFVLRLDGSWSTRSDAEKTDAFKEKSLDAPNKVDFTRGLAIKFSKIHR
jgi:hypothetical protein